MTEEGDPIWKPSLEQLAGWVANGANAAASEMYLPNLPAVERWSWSSADGIDLAEGRGLRLMLVMTPELTATVAGYAAAWQEDIWERMQSDPAAVAVELATRLRESFDGHAVTFVAGVHGKRLDMQGAIWFDGVWRRLQVPISTPLTDFVTDGFTEGALDAQWAARYLLGQALESPALSPPEEMRLHVCEWQRVPDTEPDAWLTAALPAPGFGASAVRVAVGKVERFAYVDFSLR
jgi:hypothetical protein